MNDLNEVFLFGSLDKVDVKTFNGPRGPFSTVKLVLKTDSGTFHVDYKYKSMSFVDLLQDQLADGDARSDSRYSTGNPTLLVRGFMSSNYSQKNNQWYFTVTASASGVTLVNAPIPDGAGEPKNKVIFSGTIKSLGEDRCSALLACEYSFYSKDEQKNVTGERLFYIAVPEPLEAREGDKVYGTGVPRPRFKDKWTPYIEVTGMWSQG